MSKPTTTAAKGGRRTLGALAIAICLAAAVLMPSTVQAQRQPILFGATPPPAGNAVDSLRKFEQQLGQKLGLVRVFMRWDEAGEGVPYHNEILNGGRTMHISVRAKRSNGPLMRWDSIANAQPGSQIHNEIIRWADYVKGLKGNVWFTFNQEPEIRVNDSQGSPESFRRAYRKVHQIFQQRGATNVKHAWVMSNYAFELQAKNPGDRRAAGKWYPGDDVVDMLGSDPYDWSNCRANNAAVNRPMGELVKYFLQFANAHPNEQLVISEWASSANRNQGTQAGFIDGTRELFKRSEWSRLAGVEYYATNDPAFPNCIWDPRGRADSMQALRNMQRDPAYGGAGAPQPQAPAPTVGKITNEFRGSVGGGKARWTSHAFTPSVGGRYTVKVAYSGSAKLRSDLRQTSGNVWKGAYVAERNNPFSYTVDLTAGQRVSVAVWTRSDGQSSYSIQVSR